MTLQHRICLSLCALAIAAHAAPLIENDHLKIKDGAVELDRKGDIVFSEIFSNGFANWEASNFENKLIMDVRTVLGEQAAYIGMEKPNSDTAWELAGKPFDVIGGSDFTIKIRAMGTFPLHNPSGHNCSQCRQPYTGDQADRRGADLYRGSSHHRTGAYLGDCPDALRKEGCHLP